MSLERLKLAWECIDFNFSYQDITHINILDISFLVELVIFLWKWNDFLLFSTDTYSKSCTYYNFLLQYYAKIFSFGF